MKYLILYIFLSQETTLVKHDEVSKPNKDEAVIAQSALSITNGNEIISKTDSPPLQNKKKKVYDIDPEKKEQKTIKQKRSVRSNVAKKNYSEQLEEDEEEDPFSFNSDDDPEYVEVIEQPKKTSSVVNPKKRTRKIVGEEKVKTAPKPKATKKKQNNFHKSLQTKKKKSKKADDIDNNEKDINSLNEMEYALEYAIDTTNATNVSRYGVQMQSEIKGDLVKEFTSAISTTINDVEKTLKPVQKFDETKLKKASREKMNENFVRIDLRKKVFVRGNLT